MQFVECPLRGKVGGHIIRYGFYWDEIRETPSIPVRRVRNDVLVDERHALLPSPAPKSRRITGFAVEDDPTVAARNPVVVLNGFDELERLAPTEE